MTKLSDYRKLSLNNIWFAVIFALVSSLMIVPSLPKGLASSMLSPNSVPPTAKRTNP